MFDNDDIDDIEQTVENLDRLTQKASNKDLQSVVNVYSEALILTE